MELQLQLMVLDQLWHLVRVSTGFRMEMPPVLTLLVKSLWNSPSKSVVAIPGRARRNFVLIATSSRAK